MDIDEYLSGLEAELDNQLAQFGVTQKPAGNMFSRDNNVVTEEKKFCPECGNQMAADANFCSNCGYKFNTDEEDSPREDAPVAKKQVGISIGGKRGQNVIFYNCGTQGDELWEDAQKVINEEMEASEFLDEVTENDTRFVDVFMQPDDGTVDVFVDGNDSCEIECGLYRRFDPEGDGEGPGLVASILDTSHLPSYLKEKVDEVINRYGTEPLLCDELSEFENDLVSLLGYELVDSKISELDDGSLIFAEWNALYTFSFDGEIELDANEEFDPDKLVLLSHDYDGVLFNEDGDAIFFDCVSPLVLYDNSLYLLEVNDWEVHYPGHFFRNKGENESFCISYP